MERGRQGCGMSLCRHARQSEQALDAGGGDAVTPRSSLASAYDQGRRMSYSGVQTTSLPMILRRFCRHRNMQSSDLLNRPLTKKEISTSSTVYRHAGQRETVIFLRQADGALLPHASGRISSPGRSHRAEGQRSLVHTRRQVTDTDQHTRWADHCSLEMTTSGRLWSSWHRRGCRWR